MSSKNPIHLENREQAGGRLFSPTAARNKAPIGEVISPYIPQGAKVLEIASGTGEHGAYMCGLRPDITWQVSDQMLRAVSARMTGLWIAMGRCYPLWTLIQLRLIGRTDYRLLILFIAPT